MYALIEIDGDKITLLAKLDDGRTADECLVDKEKDEIRPYRVAPIFGPGRTRMFYKGVDLGLCASSTPPVFDDGEWFIPVAVLIGFAGGEVRREKGKVFASVYGKGAEFTEGSDIAVTDKGEVNLGKKVFRGPADQLYMPVDTACKIYGMKWAYAERNNFITIEHVSEDHPVPVQP